MGREGGGLEGGTWGAWCTAGGVVAHAVGGSFFFSFCWCGMVVGHLLGVILFLFIFESSFWGSAFCLCWWWALSRWCGMVGLPLLVCFV